MLAHVAPGMDSNSETMSTLYFAEKVALVDIGSAQKSLGGVALSEFTRVCKFAFGVCLWCKEVLSSLHNVSARREFG